MVAVYRGTPRLLRNTRIWALRRALLPRVMIPMWAVAPDGSRFWLADDPADDRVLADLLGGFEALYFPRVRISAGYAPLILDVGAHHGFFAVEALRRYPSARLIALEPDPRAIPIIWRNLKANGVAARAEVVQAGIGRTDCAGVLWQTGMSWAFTTVRPQARNDGATAVPVRLATATTLLRGRHPDIVKCNAEGAEFTLFPQIFESGFRPPVVVLMAHAEHGSVVDLLALFRRSGYQLIDAGSGPGRPRMHCYLENRGGDTPPSGVSYVTRHAGRAPDAARSVPPRPSRLDR